MKLTASIAVVLLLTLGACGDATTQDGEADEPVLSPAQKALRSAYDNCVEISASLDTPFAGAMSLEDEGNTLIVATGDGQKKSEFAGFCVVGALDAPASFEARFNQTTGLQGVQEDEFDGLAVTWSYSGNNGTSLIVEVQ